MDINYSQNQEQEVILNYFGDFKGTLLDLGANNGETFSNSRALILNGFKAHLIEPSFAYIPLSELYRGNKSVTCHNLGVSDTTDVTTFYELTDSLLATTNKALADSWGVPYSERQVKMFTFIDLLKRIKQYHFDFITIDCEGLDWAILQQIDLNAVGCQCLCIEYWKHEIEITDYCRKFGLKLYHRNFENLIFVK